MEIQDKNVLLQMKQFSEDNKKENEIIKNMYLRGVVFVEDEPKNIMQICKEVNGKIIYEFYIDNFKIADLNKNNELIFNDNFIKQYGEDTKLFYQMFAEKFSKSFEDLENEYIDEFGEKELKKFYEENISKESEEKFKNKTKKDEKIEEDSIEKKLEEKEEEEVEKISEATGLDKENINFCSTLNIDSKVTATEGLKNIVPDIEKYKEIKVVSSGEIFAFVGVTEHDEYEEIEALEQTRGISGMEEINCINRDGTVTPRAKVNSMVEIQGRTDEYLSVTIGQYGIIETNYMRRDPNTNEFISSPIESETQYPAQREVTEFMDKTKNPNLKSEIQNTSEEEKTNIKNIDDNMENNNYGPDDLIPLGNNRFTTFRKEAERDKISVDGFIEEYNKASGKTPLKKIENAHEEINRQYIRNNEVT